MFDCILKKKNNFFILFNKLIIFPLVYHMLSWILKKKKFIFLLLDIKI